MWHWGRSSKSLFKQVHVADQSASVEGLQRLLRGIPTCMVTTRSDDAMCTRPMMLRTVDAAGRLLFFADQRSQMVAHLATHPQVSITFVHPHQDLYVAISGTGAIGSDPAMIRPLWKWSYRVWYPRGWRDPNLVLLEVAVKELEYWFAPSTRTTRLLRSIQALLTHQSHEEAHHGILTVGAHHGALP